MIQSNNYSSTITTTNFNNISASALTSSGLSIIEGKLAPAEIKVEPNYDTIFEKIMERLSKKPIIQYKCHNCGATIEFEESKHIFVCKYCDSVYAVGTAQINSRY